MARMKIEGLRELTKTLDKLSDEIRDRDMNFATRKGAEQFRDAAKANAHKRTGKMEANIVVRKDRDTLFDSEYFVAVRKVGKADNPSNAFYAYFEEYGTKFRPAHPFMRPAFDMYRESAINTFKARIGRRVATRNRQMAKGK